MTTDLLAHIPLFSALSLDQRQELFASLKQEPVESRRPIFWIGDLGADFYIVSHGKVTLTCPDESGREMTLAILKAGQFFGELSLLDGGRRTATAHADAGTLLLSIDRSAFQAFLLRHPATMLHVIEILAARQREMLEKLRGVANVNQVFEEHTTTWNRIADAIATVSASQTFVLTHLSIVISWITYNLLRGGKGFDPFPFMLLAMLASLEAIFLSIFVLISQNRQSSKDRVRADLDYQVNLKAHVEVMDLHQKIDRLTKLVEDSAENTGAVEEPASSDLRP